jgi:serine/threonine protein kinase
MPGMTRCGPWTLGERLCPDYSVYCVKGEHESSYLVKHEACDAEISIVARLRASSYSIANAIEFPRIANDTYGYGWYAMRRYRCDLRAAPEIPLEKVAMTTVAFLRDFHTRLYLVHGDIKAANLFIGPEDSIAIGDFGLSDNPSPRPLREAGLDMQWYYLARGGDLDQSVLSWRMDLMALGFLLLHRTWPTWTYLEEMGRYRTAGRRVQDTDWLALRDREVGAALETVSPRIRVYFERVVSFVGWGDRAPPPRVFYEELIAMFAE